MAKSDEGKPRRAEAASGTAEGSSSASMAVPALDTLLESSSRLFESWLALSTELMEFGKANLNRSLELSRAVSQSGSLNEALDLHSRYTKEVVEDCFSEANKIVGLGTRSVLDSFSRLQPQAHEAAPRAEAA
jgi:hypothetical protein